ncbi:MAG TPA: peptidylprolyl isomerase [Stellaceae bacterium]|nr:peptidylprolyl isomerase [Stellaceae bacterium]
MTPRALIGIFVLALAVSPALAQQKPATPAPKKEQPAAKKESAASQKSEAPGGDPVVARVNGVAIYRSDLEALRATLPAQAQQEAPDKLYPKLLDQSVALQLVSQAARKEKLNDDPRVKKMAALSEEQILQDAYFDGMMRKEITEAKLHQRFDQQVKSAAPREEVHARHILVPTEDEAKALIDQIKKGADFAKLASEKTTDPAGKASGGDLGYFAETDMVPEFAKVAFSLKPGEISQTPVKTQFGWHVIKVEDRRQSKPPTYEEIAPQLARQMAQELYAQKVKQMASVAKIEVFNPDGSKPAPVPAPAAPPAAAAAPAAPPPSTPAPVATAPQQPELLPLQNGTPSSPPAASGPPTLAPATQNLGK